MPSSRLSPCTPQTEQSKYHSSSCWRLSSSLFRFSMSAFNLRSDKRARAASASRSFVLIFFSSSSSCWSRSSSRMRLTSRSLRRCSRVSRRDSRAFSSSCCFRCSLCAISNSSRRLRSASSASCCSLILSILPARRLDRLEVASFCISSSSFMRRASFLWRSSSCSARMGKTCSCMLFTRDFSFGSLLLRMASMKVLYSSKVTAMSSHFCMWKSSGRSSFSSSSPAGSPNSASWAISSSSSGLVSGIVRDSRRRLLDLVLLPPFFALDLGLGVGISGGGGASVRRYRRLSSRTK